MPPKMVGLVAVERLAIAAAAAMVLSNLVLLHVLDLFQPLVWLYPVASVRTAHRRVTKTNRPRHVWFHSVPRRHGCPDGRAHA